MASGRSVFQRFQRVLIAHRVAQRFAVEFPNQEALDKYLRDHPKAKRENHNVKAPKENAGPPKAPKPPEESLDHPGQMRLRGIPKVPGKRRGRPPGAKNKPKEEKPVVENKSEKVEKAPEKEAPSTGRKSEAYKKEYEILTSQSAKMKVNDNVGAGMAGAQFVTITDDSGNSVRGVWKTGSAEVQGDEHVRKMQWGDALRPNIEVGTYYHRESATSGLDDLMGPPPIVPVTVTRTFNGEEGSVQLKLENVSSSQSMQNQLLRKNGYDGNKVKDAIRVIGTTPEAKKLTLMDMITGNDDRHGGNTLWQEKDGKYIPHAIDNGLAFPDGAPTRFIFSISRREFAVEAIKSCKETRAALSKLDLKAFHQTMVDNNIEPYARKMALVRASVFKKDPDFMTSYISRFAMEDAYRMEEEVHRFTSMGPEAFLAHGYIGKAAMKEIEDLVGPEGNVSADRLKRDEARKDKWRADHQPQKMRNDEDIYEHDPDNEEEEGESY